MTDLTKITTPFGLLDEATQKALRECGGPWQVVSDDGWEDNGGEPAFWSHMTYRQKPKPREWYILLVDRTGQRFVADSLEGVTRADVTAVRVREVLE